MKQVLRIALGLAVSVVFLYVTFRGFDLHQLKAAVVGLRWSYVAVAAAMFIGVVTLRAVRWKIVLDSIQPTALKHVAPPVYIGYLANNVLPARGGELVRAAALSRTAGVPFASSAGSLIADRVMDLFGFLMTMLIASRLLPWDRIPVLPVTAAVAVGLAGMFIALRVLRNLRPTGETGLKNKALIFARKMGDGFAAIRSPGRLASLLALSIALWLLDAGATMMLSRAAGFDLRYIECTALLTGIAAAASIPAAPGFVGTYEFFGREVLRLLGHEPTTALTFVVLLHFFQILIIAVLGVPSLFLIGRKEKAA